MSALTLNLWAEKLGVCNNSFGFCKCLEIVTGVKERYIPVDQVAWDRFNRLNEDAKRSQRNIY